MRIHQYFNRLATCIGLPLALGTSALASAEPIVPAGSNPPYMNTIYQKIIRGSTPAPRESIRIYNSITGIAPIPENDWLKQLKTMSASAAAEEIRTCFASYCEEKYPLLSDNEKFIAKIMVIEAMFADGLDDQEFRTYSEFLSGFQPAQDFLDAEDRIMDSAINTIIESPLYTFLKRKIVPARQINAENAHEQFNIRRNFIDYVTRTLRQAYGLSPVQTVLDNFPQALTTAAAYALSRPAHPDIETPRALIFNYRVNEMHDLSLMLNTVAHEVRHTLDFDMRDNARHHPVNMDDNRFQHIAVHRLNDNYYIPLCSSTSAASLACPQQFQWYKNQYVERSAQDYARKFTNKFNDKVKERESAPPAEPPAEPPAAPQPPDVPPDKKEADLVFMESRRFEAHKFKLPTHFVVA